MPRTKRKAVPESKSSVPHDNYGSSELTMVKLYRVLIDGFDRMDKHFDKTTILFDRYEKNFEDMEEENKNNQHLAGLQHQAQQPRLSAEADVHSDTKIRKRMEDAATVEDKYGDTLSARVDNDPTSLTSFEMYR